MQRVQRLEWMGRQAGETNQSIQFRASQEAQNPWYSLAFSRRMLLAEHQENQNQHQPRFPIDQQPLENSVKTTIEMLIHSKPVWEIASRDDATGRIIIPATSHIFPVGPMPNVMYMKCFEGGHQISLKALKEIVYTLDQEWIPAAEQPKKFHLVLRVATLHRYEVDFLLQSCVLNSGGYNNGTKHEIKVPYTMGLWQSTEPQAIEIGSPGPKPTSLRFQRSYKYWVMAIKDIHLIPIDD